MDEQARVDDLGRAYKGSQLQVQIYVNRRADELERAAREALSTLDEAAAGLMWASPLEAKNFKEYQDAEFLEVVGLERLVPDLARFWPARGGPVWDGLARVSLRGGDEGVLLLEGKSYPKELYGSGCAAKAEESKRLIRAALMETQEWLGVPVDADHWLGPLYQSANRLAHLYFLRELSGVQVWLLHACFTDDVDHVAVREDEWKRGYDQAERELGLGEPSLYAAAVFLPARPRRELSD